MRRVVATTILSLAALVGIPAVATAQSVGGSGYTPHAPTASVDPSATGCGSTVTVSGTLWKANSVVTIALDGQSLGSGSTNGSGSFSAAFQTPSSLSLGAHTVTESGSDQSTPTPHSVSASTTLTISACVAGLQVTGPGVVSGLAFTGSSNASLYAGLGIVLVIAGFALLAVRRRRRVGWDH